MSSIIRLENICRDFQVGDETVHALRNVNQEIAAGEYVSIMGPSGSGKSTLLNVLGLLDTPTSGKYWLDGRDVSGLDDDELATTRQQVIGFVFQSFHLVPRMTALENVELPMVLAGMPPKIRRERAGDMLARTGLTDRMSHRPDQLSGGQRQRVAIARSMVMQPKVLLADEPTGNLDTQSGREVLELLEALNREGLTLIVVTHDPEIGRRTHLHLRMVDGEISSQRSPAAEDGHAAV
jgi:putative ABC transport system ATP-binding protein